MKQETANKRKVSVALLSVASNSILVLLKLIVGIMIGSVSVISEAIHSSVDLLAALIAMLAVKMSGKPADKDHPFGHGKFENISGTVEALLIFVAAAWIIFEAIKKLQNATPLDEAGWGVAVMLISVAANIFVSRRLFFVGKETDSVALQADAWHLRTDIYTSIGVICGLGIVWIGWITSTWAGSAMGRSSCGDICGASYHKGCISPSNRIGTRSSGCEPSPG